MATKSVAQKMSQASATALSRDGAVSTGSVAEKMARASAETMEQEHFRPKKGDKFRCGACGMEIQVTAACKSQEAAHFDCCGQELAKV
jgi:hypothetical protein